MQNLYTLLKADEKQIRKILIKELKENGYTPVIHNDFIYAEGTVPVMLVGHYDTVPKPPKYVVNRNGILSAKKGLGADDRAGIYAILTLMVKHHCHILFTGGEETGGIGAKAFVKSGIKPAELNYIIEMDRRGENDAVYYQGDNEEFEEFITSFGWETDWGTYTDICELAPALGVSAVNLSIGYQNEHTHKETLDTAVMSKNIARIPAMLDGKFYEWKEKPDHYYYSGYGKSFDWYGYEEIAIKYEDKDGTVKTSVSWGASVEEALGTFFMEHPDICYQDVIDYVDYYEYGMDDDDYKEV